MERSIKTLAEAGLLGLTMPRENGGEGAGMRKFGIAEAAFAATVVHASSARLEHLKESLASGVPGIRARLAQMRIAVDSARGYLDQTLSRIEKGAPDAMLFVLGVKRPLRKWRSASPTMQCACVAALLSAAT